jgi:hypothetical protein
MYLKKPFSLFIYLYVYQEKQREKEREREKREFFICRLVNNATHLRTTDELSIYGSLKNEQKETSSTDSQNFQNSLSTTHKIFLTYLNNI